MSGEINIKISSLQGEAKNLAIAANADGSDAIDTAYEHSLFTKYMEDAGLDASEYSVKYEKGGVQKAETQLVKEQKFKDGKTKIQVANLEQYESVWQQAMKTALETVGNDPEGRAKLMDFIKTKPKLQSFTSMADYAFALGQKITEMGQIVEKDFKEFVEELVYDEGDRITEAVRQEGAEIKEAIYLNADIISQQLNEGKAEIVREIEGSEDRTAQLIRAQGNRIVKVIRNAEGNIIEVVRQEGEHTRADVNYWGYTNQEETRNHARMLHRHIERKGDEVISNDNQNTSRILTGQEQQTTLAEHSEAITRNLNGYGRFVNTGHQQSPISAFNTMIQKVQNSNLSFEKKNDLLQQLENLSSDDYIFDEELRHMDDIIEHEINGTPMQSFWERFGDVIGVGAVGKAAGVIGRTTTK